MNLFDHNDNFEQFLREAAENFKMRPSVRVWNSIYNNIHPSKKSPSAAALLVFIISFFILNANHKIVLQQEKSNNNRTASVFQKSRHLAIANEFVTPIVESKKQYSFHTATKNQSQKQIKSNTNTALTVPPAIEFDNSNFVSDLTSTPQIQEYNLHQQINQLLSGTLEKDNSVTQKSVHISEKNNDESAMSYQLYATSSVGYSNQNRNSESEILNPSTNQLQSINDVNKNLRYMPEFNLEAGGAFLVNVTSSLRLKAGMQLNYTNYKLTNDEGLSEMGNTESNIPIVNNSGQVNGMHLLNSDINNELKKFNSSTYQISIPLGTELELIGNHQLKWFAGATIQPSYLVGGFPGQNTNESKNYLDDGYGFRKWNVNTSFETFLSYKLPNGSRINAGPQLRYQLFSSYESKYLYNDKQYNIGLKLGISRNF